MFVDVEPQFGGTRGTREQQDSGRWRWEMPIADTLMWALRTWVWPSTLRVEK